MLYWIIFCIDRYFCFAQQEQEREITDVHDDEHGDGVDGRGLRDDRDRVENDLGSLGQRL